MLPVPLSTQADPKTPSHPREVDNGVSRTSGGGEEGADQDPIDADAEGQEQLNHQDQEDNEQPVRATRPSKLPKHLRERLFVNLKLQTSPTTCAQYSIPPNYICTSFANQNNVHPGINPTLMTIPGASIAHYQANAPQQGYYRTFAGLPYNPAC